ncbi:MAG: hypothetical protein ABI833_20315 [Acidobacteriota bacterium]
MEKVNPAYLYFLGHHVNALLFLRQDLPVETKGQIVFPAESALQGFVDYKRHAILFARSASLAEKLLAEVKRWAAGHGTVQELPGLFVNVQAFSLVLNEDLERSHNFILTNKGNLSVNRLIEGASAGYAKDVLELLDSRTVGEIDAAGKCLACALPTACGFHILRSVEMLVKAYVLAVNGKFLNRENRSWGTYIKWLEGIASENTLDALRILKGKRNPLMHPQHILTEPEAISIFCICQAAIETLADDISKKELKDKIKIAFEKLPALEDATVVP